MRLNNVQKNDQVTVDEPSNRHNFLLLECIKVSTVTVETMSVYFCIHPTIWSHHILSQLQVLLWREYVSVLCPCPQVRYIHLDWGCYFLMILSISRIFQQNISTTAMLPSFYHKGLWKCWRVNHGRMLRSLERLWTLVERLWTVYAPFEHIL